MRRDGRRIGWWASATIASVAYAALVLSTTPWDSWGVITPDSLEYADASERGWFSTDLWMGWRAPGYPLFLKVVGHADWLPTIQTVVSIVAWLCLAFSLAAALRRPWTRVVGFVAVLVVSLPAAVQMWNEIGLTESFSLSLTALALAGLLRIVHRPTPAWIWGTAAVLIPWMLLRDPNVYLALLVVVPVVVVVAVRRDFRSPFFAAGLVLIVVAGWMLISAGVGERARRPTTNVVTLRVLADRDMREWFVAHGMPDSPLVREQTGKLLIDDPVDGVRDVPGLESFQDWLQHDAQRTYLRYLATHPFRAVADPYDDRAAILSWYVNDLIHIAPEVMLSVLDLKPWMDTGDFLNVRSAELILAWTAIVLVLVVVRAVGSRQSRRDPRIWLGTAVIVLALIAAWTSWVGDALEITRHGIGAAVMLRLGLVITTLVVFDGPPARRRAATPVADGE